MFEYLTDTNYIEIVLLSLEVSLLAVFISCLISMPFAAFLVIKRFPARQLIVVIINTLMGLPPVVVGLFLYLLLSANGSFSVYKLLYTPTAMVIAQIIIITPIITALSKESLEMFYGHYKDYLASLRFSNIQKIKTILWEGRYSLLTNGLAGLGRAMSEVGAIIIVGGNIEHLTRTMTTGIVLETSRGEFSFAVNLGLTLLSISLLINIAVHALRVKKE
jgi:tungstate transport system permease protein